MYLEDTWPESYISSFIFPFFPTLLPSIPSLYLSSFFHFLPPFFSSSSFLSSSHSFSSFLPCCRDCNSMKLIPGIYSSVMLLLHYSLQSRDYLLPHSPLLAVSVLTIHGREWELGCHHVVQEPGSAQSATERWPLKIVKEAKLISWNDGIFLRKIGSSMYHVSLFIQLMWKEKYILGICDHRLW